jgi:hypothetical protein
MNPLAIIWDMILGGALAALGVVVASWITGARQNWFFNHPLGRLVVAVGAIAGASFDASGLLTFD